MGLQKGHDDRKRNGITHTHSVSHTNTVCIWAQHDPSLQSSMPRQPPELRLSVIFGAGAHLCSQAKSMQRLANKPACARQMHGGENRRMPTL